MWAVVEIGKKQYIAQKNCILEVERLKHEPGKVVFDKVLLWVDGKKVEVGRPYLDKVKVEAEIKAEKKGPKVTVYKFKRRKKYRKKQGHRQIHTILKISDITSPK